MHLYDVRAIGVELRVAGGSQAEVALRRNARMRATGTGAGRLVDAYSTAPVTARSSVLAPCGGSRMSGMCSQPWAWQFVYGLYMRLDALLWRMYHGQARQAAACGESARCSVLLVAGVTRMASLVSLTIRIKVPSVHSRTFTAIRSTTCTARTYHGTCHLCTCSAFCFALVPS